MLTNVSKLDVHFTRAINMTRSVSTRHGDDYVVSVYIISKMKLKFLLADCELFITPHLYITLQRSGFAPMERRSRQLTKQSSQTQSGEV